MLKRDSITKNVIPSRRIFYGVLLDLRIFWNILVSLKSLLSKLQLYRNPFFIELTVELNFPFLSQQTTNDVPFWVIPSRHVIVLLKQE